MPPSSSEETTTTSQDTPQELHPETVTTSTPDALDADNSSTSYSLPSENTTVTVGSEPTDEGNRDRSNHDQEVSTSETSDGDPAAVVEIVEITATTTTSGFDVASVEPEEQTEQIAGSETSSADSTTTTQTSSTAASSTSAPQSQSSGRSEGDPTESMVSSPVVISAIWAYIGACVLTCAACGACAVCFQRTCESLTERRRYRHTQLAEEMSSVPPAVVGEAAEESPDPEDELNILIESICNEGDEDSPRAGASIFEPICIDDDDHVIVPQARAAVKRQSSAEAVAARGRGDVGSSNPFASPAGAGSVAADFGVVSALPWPGEKRPGGSSAAPSGGAAAGSGQSVDLLDLLG
eukprot:TRINITY_DN16310_c1_g1_i2.p1 TRINITY_DN16310_c1_g1~~TRINITY_DN16310_c1_g1_i2.p1  ORF type:complete len:352 (-),score=67.02 TRINITY_DN16310_c1_g1_i2:22-1077(-)